MESQRLQKNYLKPLILLGFLAIMLLVSSTIKNILTPKKTQLALPYLEVPFEAPPTLMNAETVVLDDWTIAMSEYKKNNFDAAASKISNIKRRTVEQELYLGLSHLYDTNNNNLALSLASFENVMGFPNSKFNDIALWYAALNCLQVGLDTRAKEYLDKIIETKSWNHKKAVELRNLMASK